MITTARLFIDPLRKRATGTVCIFRQQNYSHLISDSLFRRMYNTQVRFACLIYFSRDHSSIKLIIFLDPKLVRLNSRVAKLDSRLDSRNFRGSRIESPVEFRDSRMTVNLPLSGTVLFSAYTTISFLCSIRLSPRQPRIFTRLTRQQ